MSNEITPPAENKPGMIPAPDGDTLPIPQASIDNEDAPSHSENLDAPDPSSPIGFASTFEPVEDTPSTLNEIGEEVVRATKNGNLARYISLVLIALVLLTGLAITLTKSSSTKTNGTTPLLASKSDGQGIEINPKAKIKVDFYEDFRCPNCRNFEALNNAYIDKIVASGQIDAVFHPMSFIASDSLLAAAASACASDEGYYLAMHTALYAYQPSPYKVSERTAYWTDKTLVALGHSIGITSPKYDSCVNTGKYLTWANSINTYAASQNINGTPTVIVNGNPVSLATDYSASAFQKMFANLGVK